MMEASVIRRGAIGLLVCLIVAGCAGRKGPPDPEKVRARLAEAREGERELVRSRVADAERAERLLELLEERDRLVHEQAQRVTAHRERMRALNQDYAATRQDFERALATYNRERAEWQREALDLMAAMREATTEEEWDALSKYQLDKLDWRKSVYAP